MPEDTRAQAVGSAIATVGEVLGRDHRDAHHVRVAQIALVLCCSGVRARFMPATNVLALIFVCDSVSHTLSLCVSVWTCLCLCACVSVSVWLYS
jgi:hypothetical protein